MSRNIRIREYHEEVAAKLRGLASGAAPISSKLGIEAGGFRWLVDLAMVSEVIAMPDCVPVPLTRPWYRGVANVRGNLYGIVDFSHFLGEEPTPPSQENRLLLPASGFNVHCGLLVKRVLGLRNPSELKPLPPAPGSTAWTAGEYADATGAPWKELDFPTLVASPDFLNIARYKRRDVFSNALQQA